MLTAEHKRVSKEKQYKSTYPVKGGGEGAETDISYNCRRGRAALYIVGVGVEQWQFPLDRPECYEFPQILVSANGEGEINIEGRTERLTEGTVVYIPPHCPHAYHAAVILFHP